MIVDRSRNEKQQDLRLSTNLTRVFVLYITLPKVQNEDPCKIVWKSPQNFSSMIVDQSRNKEQQDLKQDLRLSTNLTRVFILYQPYQKYKTKTPSKWLEHDNSLKVCILYLPACCEYLHSTQIMRTFEYQIFAK